jgi:hypothetical protein
MGFLRPFLLIVWLLNKQQSPAHGQASLKQYLSRQALQLLVKRHNNGQRAEHQQGHSKAQPCGWASAVFLST